MRWSEGGGQDDSKEEEEEGGEAENTVKEEEREKEERARIRRREIPRDTRFIVTRGHFAGQIIALTEYLTP